MTFDAIAQWLNNEGYREARGRTFRGARSLNLEEEISKGRVAESSISPSLVRLQYGGGR